jgi:hypothetical protein
MNKLRVVQWQEPEAGVEPPAKMVQQSLGDGSPELKSLCVGMQGFYRPIATVTASS